MNPGVRSLSVLRASFGVWDRFGVIAVTLFGLLSLAVALHVDQVDRERTLPMVIAR